MRKYAIMAFAAAALVPAIAVAQTTTDTSAVDVTPLITQLFNDYVQPLIGVVIAAIVGYLGVLANKRLGLSITDAMKQQIDDFVTQQAGAILAKIVNTRDFQIHIGNPIIAEAARQAEAHIGDALRAVGITPQMVEDFVSKLIVAKLGVMTASEPDAPTPAGAVPGTNVTADGSTIAPAPAPAPAS